MIVFPDMTSIWCTADFCFRYVYLLLLLPLVIGFIFWYLPKITVKFTNKLQQKEYVQRKQQDRRFVAWFRIPAMILIIIALASPFMLTDKTVQGNPRLMILVDNSTSMSVFESGLAQDLFDSLNGIIPVKLRTIASGDRSPLGTGILNYMEGGENVLVVTDGNSNHGKLLGDVMLFASSINATVSTLEMNTEIDDVGVSIEGPRELIKDNEGEFTVMVNNIGTETSYNIEVVVDDVKTVIQEQTSGTQEFTFPHTFTDSGYHTITATLSDVEDYTQKNNVYYKSVKVVPRPKLLYIAPTSSPLLTELQQLYQVDYRLTIPSNLDEYLVVVLDNLPISSILPSFDLLNSYVESGNGLVVVGGEQAFESGGYKGTLFETLLPVRMGSGEESEKSDVNIVIVLDISDASGEEIPIEKALAISVLDSLNDANNVGAVAFNQDAYEIEPIKPLEVHKDELVNKISRLAFDGQSFFHHGLQGAYDLLKDTGGSKNVIFLSDGYTTYEKLKQDTINTARNLEARGVKIYTVGVGDKQDSLFLGNIAQVGGGIYFKADISNKLKILFGDSDPSKGPEYYNALVSLDTTHFITKDMEYSATVSGYNYVVPKSSARLLVTTNKNIPILTVWRFGLGRVAALSTDDGSKWGGELLNSKNSQLFTRTINWAIGDLSRKKSFDVTIYDTTLDEPAIVNVVASELPTQENMLFAKLDTNFYAAEYQPTQEGYFTVMGATGAANYKEEFENLGVSQEFIHLVNATGGKVFNPDDTDAIIEFVKTHSKRIKITSRDLRWPLLIGALVLFLVEICIRRIRENRGENQ